MGEELKDLEEFANKTIDRKLLTALKTHLRQVPNNVLIAGAEKKADAVRSMIERGYVRNLIVCVGLTLANKNLRS